MLQIFIGIITTPAMILGGFVALLGLALQGGKHVSEVIKGTVKTILGLLILSAGGAGVIVDNLIPFSGMFTEGFGLTGGVVPFDEAVVGGALTEKIAVIARTTSLILAFGFVVNLITARVSAFKYIFLTGHMMWILAGAISWALYDLGVPEMSIIIFGSVVQGIVLTFLPVISQPIMRKITGNDTIAYGHLTTIGVVVSAYVGKLVGNVEKNSEDIKLPKGLDFFKDTAVSVSLVMVVIYVITAVAAGNEYVAGVAGDQNFIVFSILKGLGFAAGVLILLQGVRMFLGDWCLHLEV